MYTLGDKSASVKVVQKSLNEIGKSKNIALLQKVVVNGIYDNKTKDAVFEFQRINSIPLSGTVNEATFSELREQYRIAVITNEAPKEIAYPLKVDDSGDYMININSMLNEVYENYYGASEIRINGYFSHTTSDAVKKIQEAFTFDITGEIDERFHKRLTDEVYSIKNSKNVFF